MNRYVIAFLACLGLAILVTILLISSSGKPTTPPPKPFTILPDYASSSAQVEIVTDGPIVAPTKHNSTIITIDKNSANFQLIQGYDGDVISSKTFANSENSFKNFLYALYYAGYTSSVKSKYPSDIGLCSTGTRYDMYLVNNGQTLMHTYTTSCYNVARTFGGNFNLTNTLFEAQIPNLANLVTNTNL